MGPSRVPAGVHRHSHTRAHVHDTHPVLVATFVATFGPSSGTDMQKPQANNALAWEYRVSAESCPSPPGCSHATAPIREHPRPCPIPPHRHTPPQPQNRPTSHRTTTDLPGFRSALYPRRLRRRAVRPCRRSFDRPRRHALATEWFTRSSTPIASDPTVRSTHRSLFGGGPR